MTHKLHTLGARVASLQASIPTLTATLQAEPRIRGRTLQAMRLRIWLQDPTCKGCGRVTSYPAGFELDHKVRLEHGGSNADSNLQILCVDPRNRDAGCHAMKTKEGQ